MKKLISLSYLILSCSLLSAQNDLRTFDIVDPSEIEGSKWVGIVEPQNTDYGNIATSLRAVFTPEGTLQKLGTTNDFNDNDFFSVERNEQGQITVITSNAVEEGIVRKVYYTYDENGWVSEINNVYIGWDGNEIKDMGRRIERAMDYGMPKSETYYNADGSVYANMSFRYTTDEYGNWTSRKVYSKELGLSWTEETRTITYNAGRHFNFNPSEISVVWGDEPVLPKLEGDISDIGYGGNTYSYSSSDESVVIVDKEGKVRIQGVGTAVVTIHVPASVNKGAGDYGEGETSYTLHVLPFEISGSTETITLTEAGTLRSALADLESTDVGSLTLRGPVNGSDLKVINEHAGRLSNLQVLDMSGVTLVPDDVLYASWGYRHDVGMGSSTYNYYLSSDERVTSSSSSTGLGGGNFVENHYTMELAALFNGFTSLRSVSLPAECRTVGSHLFTGCESLASVTLPDGITEIGDAAFSGCTNLADVNFGTLTTIGESAFAGTAISHLDLCQIDSIGESAFKGSTLMEANLTNLITIPKSAFKDCTMLKDVMFGDALLEICDYAFMNTAITDAYLHEGLTTIGYQAFAYSKIKTSNVPQSLLSVSYASFSNTPWEDGQMESVANEGIIYFGNIAYRYWSYNDTPATLVFRDGTVAISENFSSSLRNIESLTSLVLPSSLKWIGDGGYRGLTSLELPEGLEHIGEGVFAGSKLTSITIPEGLTWLGDGAFSNSSLVRVNYNAKYAEGKSAFAGCKGLDKVVIGPEVEYLQPSIFYNCENLIKVEFTDREQEKMASHSVSAAETSATAVELFIDNAAFSSCSLLSSCPLPTGTTSISEGAFRGTALTTAELPHGLKHIGSDAFAYTPITTISLPATIEYMDGRSFSGCDKVAKIYNYMTTPYQFDSDAHIFQELAKTANLYVLPELVYVYDADPVWTAFYIFEMDDEHIGLGIDDVEINNNGTVIYDLQGRRVQNPKHGIYIVNGRKIKL